MENKAEGKGKDATLPNQLSRRDRHVLIKRDLKGIQKIPGRQIKDALELCQVREKEKLNISKKGGSEDLSAEEKFPNKKLALLREHTNHDTKNEGVTVSAASSSALKESPNINTCADAIKNEYMIDNVILKMEEVDDVAIEWCVDGENLTGTNETEITTPQLNSDTILKEEVIIEDYLLEAGYGQSETIDYNGYFGNEEMNSIQRPLLVEDRIEPNVTTVPSCEAIIFPVTNLVSQSSDSLNKLPDENIVLIRSNESNNDSLSRNDETIDYNGYFGNEEMDSIQQPLLVEDRIEPNVTIVPSREAIISPVKDLVSQSSGNSNQLPDDNIVLMRSDKSNNDSLSGNDAKKQDDWKLIKKFTNYKTASQYMTQLNLLLFTKKILPHKVKEHYKCKFSDGTTNKCPTSHILQYKDLSKNILMYSKKVEHRDNCPNADPLISKNKQSGTKDFLPLNRKNWQLEKKLCSVHTAKDYLTAQDIWSYKKQTTLGADTIAFYRCKLPTAKGNECAAARYIHVTQGRYTNVWKSTEDHTHAPLT